MVRQAIKSPIFTPRGRLTPNIFSRLIVRGGGSLVDEALKRSGWNGSSPVITVVATAEIGTGTVRGVRYEARGRLNDIKFRANELWKNAEGGITVCLKFESLASLNWVSTGETRNQTHWVDGVNVRKTMIKDDGTALESEDDLFAHGIGAFAVRFTAIPLNVETVALNAGIIPLSKAELAEKVSEMGLTVASPCCPTLSLKLLTAGTRAFNATPAKLLPTESQDDKVGWGHLPLIEVIGSGVEMFPDSDRLEEEMVEFLRAVTPTNNVGLTRLLAMYDSDNAFSSSLSGSIPNIWPEYRGALPSSSGEAQGLLVMFQ